MNQIFKERTKSWTKLIEAIMTPFNLLVLIVIIGNVGLLTNIPLAPPSLKYIFLYVIGGQTVLALLIIAAFVAWCPDKLFYSEQSLAHSLGVDIFEALVIYTSNFKTKKEQQDAIMKLVDLMKNMHDPQHSCICCSIADVIQQRVDILVREEPKKQRPLIVSVKN